MPAAGRAHADRTHQQPFSCKQAVDVWSALGCRVVKMTPESHDAAFAAVSHLPHLIAFALMNAISGPAAWARTSCRWPGPGFRDFTRIAASDPAMWRDVMLSNREELLSQSRIFQRNLQALELMISSGNTTPC
jgi:prephenate dehydrogenase